MTDAPPIDKHPQGAFRRIAVVVGAYPSLSETFIAQELLALQQRHLPFELWSLRRTRQTFTHPAYRGLAVPVTYLPSRLHRAPLRVMRGVLGSFGLSGFSRLLRQFGRDFARDRSLGRLRLLGQAFVMAHELPADIGHLHAHFLGAPAAVARYAAMLRGITWSFSAHAGDVWTTPDWEKREKLADSLWGVASTRAGWAHLAERAPRRDHVALAYHGLDLYRYPAPLPPSNRDGSDPEDPVRIVSVGRAEARKGFDDVLSALAALPRGLHWRFVHIGEGALLAALNEQALQQGIDDKVTFLGSQTQPELIALLREADLFVLASKVDQTGDRDGLPTAIMEAASQGLAIVATDVAGIPEFIRHEQEGVLVQPARSDLLAAAIERLARDPRRRMLLGFAASDRLREDFAAETGVDVIEARLRAALGVAVSFTPVKRDPVL